MRRGHPRGRATAWRQCGLTLIELLIAAGIGALLLGGLGSVARQGVLARAQTRNSAEAVYQARFALQRVTAAATGTAPHSLLAPAANTSGDWFSPIYFCVNASGALIETIASDAACASTQVIAERVSTFAATLPAGAGALEAISASVAITLAGPTGGAPVTLTERVRLGGVQ